MIILSLKPLTEKQIGQVKDILRQSKCPHESLRKTFSRYSGIHEGKIFFDDAQILWQDFSDKFRDKNLTEIIGELDQCRQFILTVI